MHPELGFVILYFYMDIWMAGKLWDITTRLQPSWVPCSSAWHSPWLCLSWRA